MATKLIEARRGPSRPASDRASTRFHCKNCGSLNDSWIWRPEGTRDFIILNKGPTRPPRHEEAKTRHARHRGQNFSQIFVPSRCLFSCAPVWGDPLPILGFRACEIKCGRWMVCWMVGCSLSTHCRAAAINPSTISSPASLGARFTSTPAAISLKAFIMHSSRSRFRADGTIAQHGTLEPDLHATHLAQLAETNRKGANKLKLA